MTGVESRAKAKKLYWEAVECYSALLDAAWAVRFDAEECERCFRISDRVLGRYARRLNLVRTLEDRP